MTPDATYRDLPLTRAAYAASLRLLREVIAAGGAVSSWRATTLDADEHEARVALHQCGALATRFWLPWCAAELTPYGRRCAAERLAGGDAREEQDGVARPSIDRW